MSAKFHGFLAIDANGCPIRDPYGSVLLFKTADIALSVASAVRVAKVITGSVDKRHTKKPNTEVK